MVVPRISWTVVCFADVGVTARSARLFSTHAQELGYVCPVTTAKLSI